MPNHIKNKIEIIGTEEQVKNYRTFFYIPQKRIKTNKR
jgi:hypothetical protein